MYLKVKNFLVVLIATQIVCISVTNAQTDLTNQSAKQSNENIDTDKLVEESQNDASEIEPVGPVSENFEQEEVIAVGEKFFGKVSTGIAAVIENAFSRHGKPKAYILGTEASIAFIGGYGFGAGEIHQLGQAPQNLFWKGPSLGFDFGLDGNRVMMLIYNLPESGSIQKRYFGIDGSAYIIGGFGMSALSNGEIFILRIRAGLGLRLGANLGYLKIRSERSLNPF